MCRHSLLLAEFRRLHFRGPQSTVFSFFRLSVPSHRLLSEFRMFHLSVFLLPPDEYYIFPRNSIPSKSSTEDAPLKVSWQTSIRPRCADGSGFPSQSVSARPPIVVDSVQKCRLDSRRIVQSSSEQSLCRRSGFMDLYSSGGGVGGGGGNDRINFAGAPRVCRSTETVIFSLTAVRRTMTGSRHILEPNTSRRAERFLFDHL